MRGGYTRLCPCACICFWHVYSSIEECSLPLSLHENGELPDAVVFAQPLLLTFWVVFFYGATTLIESWPSRQYPSIKAVLYLFCPLHNLHLLQIIPDIIFPSRLGPSSWSSCEWFPFVYSFYYASFGHSIYVSQPTQSLGFNIIYYVPVFN